MRYETNVLSFQKETSRHREVRGAWGARLVHYWRAWANAGAAWYRTVEQPMFWLFAAGPMDDVRGRRRSWSR